MTGHIGSVHSLLFNHEGTCLISAGADRLIRLWDTSDGRLIRTLEQHSRPVHALALSPDGSQLASAGETARSGSGKCPRAPCGER